VVRLAMLLNWEMYAKKRGAAIVFPFVDANGMHG
jgi:hypothetical protein